MLVEFSAGPGTTITVFGAIATRLLRLMHVDDAIPGRLSSQSVPAARRRLESALTFQSTLAPTPDDGQAGGHSLGRQARPLIALLETAERNDHPVVWRSSQPENPEAGRP